MLSAIEKVIFLKEVPFFQGMTVEQLRVLADVCEEEFFPAETRLFNEGDPGGILYVVVSGRVGIEQEKRKGSFARLATVEAHAYLGEADFFDNNGRTQLGHRHSGHPDAAAAPRAVDRAGPPVSRPVAGADQRAERPVAGGQRPHRRADGTIPASCTSSTTSSSETRFDAATRRLERFVNAGALVRKLALAMHPQVP